MKQLIDELDDLIYISDVDTYELLYINQRFKELLRLKDDVTGRPCYEILKHRTSPCEDCDNALLSRNSVSKGEVYSPDFHMAFFKRAKLLDWHGRNARIELAADITESLRVKQGLNDRLDTEYRLIDCINRLNAAECLEEAIRTTLKELGNFFQADRLLLYEIDEGEEIKSFYYWESEQCPASWDYKHLSGKLLPVWKKLYEKQQSGCLLCLEEIKELDPAGYDILAEAGVGQVMYESAILPKGKTGFFEMDNPRAHLVGCNLIFPYLNFVIDEIRERRMQKELEHLSFYDELTDAGNRRRYNWFQKQLVSLGYKSIGIAVVNINGMGSMNTKYGQSYGDHILVSLAGTLIKIFGQEHVFRTSGDEFTVVCAEMEQEAFEEKTDRVMAAVNGRNSYYAACGAVWDDGQTDLQLLTDTAKEQMQQQKMEFYRQEGQGAGRTQREEQQLLKAIRQGYMKIYFQPKVNVATRRLAGAEALVRYVDQEHGVVTPAKFIGRLEAERTVWYLDCYVLKTIGDMLEQRYQEGRQLFSVSLNFSRVTLTWPRLFQTLEGYLKGWHFPISCVEIEITESTDGIGTQTMKLIAGKLRALGFSISLDDFGIQYANLSIFGTLYFDVLKMDKSLINDITDNPRNRIIIQGVIDVCHKMDTKCLAEGVEREAQYEVLRNMGCDYIQGYLFGKPMEQADFLEQYQL